MIGRELKRFGQFTRYESSEKDLMRRKAGSKLRRGRKRLIWTDSVTGAMKMNLQELIEAVL